MQDICPICGYPMPSGLDRRRRPEDHVCRPQHPKECHTRTKHQHGTSAAYRSDKCRCVPCRRAERRYRLERELHPRGQVQVDAAPSREHIAALVAAGGTYASIARHTGLTVTAIERIAAGARTSVMAQTQKLILALSETEKIKFGFVDASGATRRLRALAARGWSSRSISEAMGWNVANRAQFDLIRQRRRSTISQDTMRRVVQAYDELWDKEPDQQTSVQKQAAARMRNTAAREGWPVPMDLDDYELDIPFD